VQRRETRAGVLVAECHGGPREWIDHGVPGVGVGQSRVCECPVRIGPNYPRRLLWLAFHPNLSPYLSYYVSMGNSASSSSSSYRVHHEDTVDFGYLTPQGVYFGTRDWKEGVVTQLIVDRKLAPFYRPLEDYDSSWDDDRILAARKEAPVPAEHEGTSPRSDVSSSATKSTHHKRASLSKELPRNAEAAIYRDATECPICFLVCLLPVLTAQFT
jgi:hypothetical protein